MGRGGAPGEGFRVPDAKCFEGQSGGGEGGREGAVGEEQGEAGGTGFVPPGPSLGLVAPGHSLAPLEGSEDCRTSVHSCMVLCSAWVFSLSTWT